MAFTYDPTTTRGKVRLLIADTDTVTAANQIFEDAEIDSFLSMEDQDIYAAAASACRSIGLSTARSAVAWKSMSSSLDKRDVPKHFLSLAKEYQEKAERGTPWEEIDSLDYRISSFGEDLSEYVGDET